MSRYDAQQLLTFSTCARFESLRFTHDAKLCKLIRGSDIKDSQFLPLKSPKEAEALVKHQFRSLPPKPLPPMLLKFMQEEASRIHVPFRPPQQGTLDSAGSTAVGPSHTLEEHVALDTHHGLGKEHSGEQTETIGRVEISAEDDLVFANLKDLICNGTPEIQDYDGRTTFASVGSESSSPSTPTMELVLELGRGSSHVQHNVERTSSSSASLLDEHNIFPCLAASLLSESATLPLTAELGKVPNYLRLDSYGSEGQADWRAASASGIAQSISSSTCRASAPTSQLYTVPVEDLTLPGSTSRRTASTTFSVDSEAQALDDAHGLTQSVKSAQSRQVLALADLQGMAVAPATTGLQSETPFVKEIDSPSNTTQQCSRSSNTNAESLFRVQHGETNQNAMTGSLARSTSTSSLGENLCTSPASIGKDSYISSDEFYPLEQNYNWGDRPRKLINWESTAPEPAKPMSLPSDVELSFEDMITEEEKLWLGMKQGYGFEADSVDHWLSNLHVDGTEEDQLLNTKDIPRSFSPPPELQKVLNRKFEDASGPVYRKMLRRFRSGRSFLQKTRTTTMTTSDESRIESGIHRAADVRAIQQMRKMRELAAASEGESDSSDEDLR